MSKPLTMLQRWEIDEEIDAPRVLDAEPRWVTDDLAEQYGPGAVHQPTLGDDETATD